MFELRFKDHLAPAYQSQHSAGADLMAATPVLIPAGAKAKVGTGVWIEGVCWSEVPHGFVPELQIRARSGLAYKHGITLTNGIGTIDADYRDEICVLLWNSSQQDFTVQVGDRIAQMVLNLCVQIPALSQHGTRTGGFGSTGLHSPATQSYPPPSTN